MQLYFDETFTADCQAVQRWGEKYMAASTELISLLESISEKEKLNSVSKLNKELYDATLKTLSGQMTINKEHINNKRKEPSRSISLVPTTEVQEKIKALVVVANQEISKHNQVVENLHVEKQKLIAQIWRYVTAEYQDNIKQYLEKEKKIKAGINGLGEKVSKSRENYLALDSEIKRLTQNVTSVQPSIDEINRILQLYGFNNFQIVPSPGHENQYQIQREDGTLAENTLSEGGNNLHHFSLFHAIGKRGN